MSFAEYWPAWLVSNLVALLLLLAAIKRPRTGRILFALLFIGAGIVNNITIHTHPSLYQLYADTTFLSSYRHFINGYFAANSVFIVSMIALCQLIAGFALLNSGWFCRTGCIGGILFLLAITPLGIGAAFPSTIVMAVGLYLLCIRTSGISPLAGKWPGSARSLINQSSSS
ncbi:MAG: hypothetical protein J0H92_03090 [Sphingobacteriales bacterium]|jgi:hypothetical protein|nr:hypothetical protein [Sphingobacteriales bacterium]NCT73273.1 hypothetical protein [Chitinophagaceae bacterium]OJW35232.1 MAG: hypothetical protein BGO54_03565 [Sphingobacteriales bacterium 46-32]